MLSRLLTFAALLALPLAAVACTNSSVNDAPVIDSVEAPLVVSEQNGAYTIPVTVLFHDTDRDVVTHVRYRLGPTIEGTVDVPAANPTRESAVVAIVIAGSALDEEAEQTTLTSAEGKHLPSDTDHAATGGEGRAGGRGQVRTLQLSLIDGRGAESRALSSTVTLD
jgi:hypothetical protein